MIFWFTGIVLSIAALIFKSIPALIIGLLVVGLGMLTEKNGK